jgi:hypothetical protein
MIEPDMSQMTIQRMHYACCIPKATDIHSKYVIRIAVPQQQWFHERTTVLRLYVYCWLVTELNFMNFEILTALSLNSEE